MPSTTLLMQEGASGKRGWGKDVIWEPGLVISSNYSFTSTTDGDTVVKYYKSLTINSGVTVTTSTRCKGLVLFIDGDCTINGTLTMTNRGAISVGDNLAIDVSGAQFLVNPDNWSGYNFTISATGGAGGTYIHKSTTGTTAGKAGSIGQSNACGGGGGGAAGSVNNSIVTSGSGSAGTSYSGGSGGGGCCYRGSNTLTSGSATINGGAGGNAKVHSDDSGVNPTVAGGGAGNGPGSGAAANGTYIAANTGTGGLLILVVRGNLTIGSTGIISSKGGVGGGAGGGSGTNYSVHAGGGGSGGGSIMILYNGIYTNSGSILATGGAGGPSTGGTYNAIGGAGGVGSIFVNYMSL